MEDIYKEGSYEPRKSVGYLMHRVRSEMLAAIDKELMKNEQLASLGVSSAQYIILSLLGKEGVQSTASLCKGMSYDAGAMTRMVDRLEDKGLLRRQRDANDRRQINLELTEEGLALLPDMRRASMAVTNRFLAGFSPEEARRLEGYLLRMLENVPQS